MDTNNKVVLGGASSATVTAGTTASATVNLVEGVSDYDSLQKAVGNGGTVNILKSIDVPSSLTVGTNVTIQAAYQDVTLKNISSGNLFIVDTNGTLTIGGGVHTITLDGNQVASSIIKIDAGTATLASNGIIKGANTSGVVLSQLKYGTFNMTGGEIRSNTGTNGGGVAVQSGTFSMTGGSIEGNSAGTNGGGVFMSGGTFSMTGGSIEGNSAKANGNGVRMSNGIFQMSGSAVIDSNNDVYLNSGKQITITGEITAEVETVATITPSEYAENAVLANGTDDNLGLVTEVGKFAVTPNPADGSEWTIDTEGKLQQVQ